MSLRSEHESVRLDVRGSFVVCDGCAFPGYRYDFGFWSRTEKYDILFSASGQKTRMHTRSKCEMSRPKSDLITMTIPLETYHPLVGNSSTQQPSHPTGSAGPGAVP